MPDCMTFPDDPLAFVDEYSFEDKDHVYTNGSKLIPAFRVKQGLEHYFAYPSGWISVKDKLPDKDRMVCIVAVKGYTKPFFDMWINNTEKKIRVGDASINDIPYAGWLEFSNEEVTHWMPMPDLPKEDS